MKRLILFSFLAISFLLVSNCSLAEVVPAIPASYYGSITLDNAPAEKNKKLDSCINGISKGDIQIIEKGQYGNEAGLKLPLAGSSEEFGEIAYFCLGPWRSDKEFTWTNITLSEIKELPLTFTSGTTDGCPACVVNWVCNEWSACYLEEGENIQNCTLIEDTNNCSTDYNKPSELVRYCQPETNGDNANNNDNGGGGTTTPSDTEDIPDNNYEPTEEPESSEQATIPEEVKKNQEASFNFFNSKVLNIKVLFNQLVENPSLTVKVFNEKSAGVSEISSNKIVYKYISIDKNFDSDKIEQATIKFKVETGWMAKNGVNSDNIILMHFNINGWEELPTTLTGMEGGSYIFEAETKTLSLFAITAKEKTNKLNIAHIITILEIIICVILILFLIKKYKNKKKKFNINKRG